MGQLHDQGYHQHNDDDAGNGLLQHMQAAAQKMFHPAVPALQTLDVGFDLGIVRFDVMVTHGSSSLEFVKNHFTGKAKKKEESFPGSGVIL
jgi:hypothetical protein